MRLWQPKLKAPIRQPSTLPSSRQRGRTAEPAVLCTPRPRPPPRPSVTAETGRGESAGGTSGPGRQRPEARPTAARRQGPASPSAARLLTGSRMRTFCILTCAKSPVFSSLVYLFCIWFEIIHSSRVIKFCFFKCQFFFLFWQAKCRRFGSRSGHTSR